MKMKYVLPIAFSAMLLSSCDDMAFLQIKPDNLELIEDRITLKNYCWAPIIKSVQEDSWVEQLYVGLT